MGTLKPGREEPPHVRGQGQKPGGPHARRTVAKRSYPNPRSGAAAESTKLRRHRNGREELPRVRGQGWGGRGAAKRRYPASEVRGGGQEEIPHAPNPRPGAAGRRSYPRRPGPRPRAAGGRSNPTSKELWLRGCRSA